MFITMNPPFRPNYPAAGTLLNTFCSGTTKMGTYADGNGGSFSAVIQENSTDCGYVPYPAYGTPTGYQYCEGTTLMGRYANGNGGTFDAVIEYDSSSCGYTPPLQGGSGVLRVNVQWDGACDVDLDLQSPEGYHYGYGHSGGGTGLWDYDSVTAGQENVFFDPSAPNGNYVLTLVNWSGTDAGTITVTVVANGVTSNVDMTGQLPLTARGRSFTSVYFSYNQTTGFTSYPARS